MGSGFSSFATKNSGSDFPWKPGLGDLPESCIALILLRLEPSEICRFASVNKTFRLASLSNYVWEKKLPENHQFLVKKLVSGDACSNDLISKKEIFARLSCPVRFATGTKEVWLDKSRGGISVAISWKGLKIACIDDRRYWSHISTDESRFNTVAYLHQTWWLELEGNFEFEFPVGKYSLFFRLQLGRPSKARRIITCNNIAEKNIHGWDIKPVRFQLESYSSNSDAILLSDCFLEEEGKWLYHHVGDFVVENSSIPTRLKFSMTQIDCTHTKGGLCVDSVFIFPSRN